MNNFFEAPHVTDRVASVFSVGFRKKTSPGRQIFHQVAPFCQDAVLTFSNDMRWNVKVAPGKPQTDRVKLKISPDTREAKFSLGEGNKSAGSGFAGSVTEPCFE